jgi:hypothetical protein
MRRHAQVVHQPGPRHILITQCLQNDLFGKTGCKIGLPEAVAEEMLLGKKRHEDRRIRNGHRYATGPLGLFLAATIGARASGSEGIGTLHVVNIRDWHKPGPSYDDERRVCGRHCEVGTPGAAYLSGLEHYLDPAGSTMDEPARYFAAGSVRVYHIHSDTLFDFRPEERRGRKFSASVLENLLDVIIEGTDEELARLHDLLSGSWSPSDLHELAEVVEDSDPAGPDDIYIAVIGVYTDIKVKTVLTGLRSLYDVENVAVSDTFTTSTTLERHLAGLDFAKKVLHVEVIHGINDLVRFLGGSKYEKRERELVAAERYGDYQLYFQDQQNVLAYQSQRLQEYLALMERRALKVYDTISRSNTFLILWGSAFLVATLVLALLSAVWPDQVSWELPAVTGGISLVQFVGVFFSTPATDLQANLTNLASFKMILESHSLKTAIMRFHLTTARTLRPIETEGHLKAAERQIETLRKQLEVIANADAADFERFAALACRVGEGDGLGRTEVETALKLTTEKAEDGGLEEATRAGLSREAAREEAR